MELFDICPDLSLDDKRLSASLRSNDFLMVVLEVVVFFDLASQYLLCIVSLNVIEQHVHHAFHRLKKQLFSQRGVLNCLDIFSEFIEVCINVLLEVLEVFKAERVGVFLFMVGVLLLIHEFK